MSHPEQLGFFRLCAQANTQLLTDACVLEIGSCDVNGSVREVFSRASHHVGVDLAPGPSVDVIADGSDRVFPDRRFDLVVSGECFEHNPGWRETFQAMAESARGGGVVAFTCASRGRVEHGTRRTAAHDSPGSQAVGWDYYRNVLPEDLDKLPLAEWFSTYESWYLPASADLYFCGVKRFAKDEARGEVGTMPRTQDVYALGRMMPLRLRILRLPLRLLGRVVRSEPTFQQLAIPYWRGVARLVRAKQAVMGVDPTVGYGPQ